MAARVLAYYARSAALLDVSFSGSPIIFADFPRGFHTPPRFRVTQIPLSSSRIGWLAQREYAVEFHTAAGVPGEPERLRFGRIVLEPPRAEHAFTIVRDAALIVREALLAAGYDAVPVVDGIGGIVLWLPFIESPPATKVRARLQRFCARVAASHPDTLASGALPSEHCVRLDASVNAPGKYSVLPYSLRGTPALPICTPVAWDELERLGAATVATVETWLARFDACGDLFGTAVAALASQHLRSRRGAADADAAAQ